MKWLLAILIFALLGLQYRLWVGEGSYAQLAQLTREIAKQKSQNIYLSQRNEEVAIQVEDLKHGLDSIEARARNDMGMVKKGETFFIIHKKDD